MLRPKKKFTKKEIKHDPLLETLYQINQYYEANKRRLITFIGIVIAVVVVVWVGIKLKITSEHDASRMLGKALISIQIEEFEEARQQLEPILSEYPNTSDGSEVLFYLGLISLEQEDFIRARQYFSDYLNSADNPDLECGVLSKIAYTYEKDGDYSMAAEYYEQASEICEGTYQRRSNVLNSILNYVKVGEFNKANVKVHELSGEENLPRDMQGAIDEIRGRIQILTD